jgi:lipopolysaccharide/colanic/teichoic acid biosynthesis glycosyltransferase
LQPAAAAAPAVAILRFAFDWLCAAFGLPFLLPVLAVVAVAIKLDDGGAVFYAQRRVGKDLRVFQFFKFRTMLPGSDRHSLLTAPDDARLTRVGRFLRRYKLDELPQLFNVLKGDMQLVGPRPEVERYVSLFRAEYSSLLRERPGITDPATLAYRHEEKILRNDGTGHQDMEQQYISVILPDKLRLSLAYQRRRGFASDLRTVLQTVLRLFV